MWYSKPMNHIHNKNDIYFHSTTLWYLQLQINDYIIIGKENDFLPNTPQSGGKDAKWKVQEEQSES